MGAQLTLLKTSDVSKGYNTNEHVTVDLQTK